MINNVNTTGQLTFNDISYKSVIEYYFENSKEEINKECAELQYRISKAKEGGNFRMTKELYDEILNFNHPKVYLFLLGDAAGFNRTYYGYCKDEKDIVPIDIVEIYRRILTSKDCFLISIALEHLKLVSKYTITNDKMEQEYYYEKCIAVTQDYLRQEKNNKAFFYEFMYSVAIDWNNIIDLLLEKVMEDNPGDSFLWNQIVKNNLLNGKNMNILIGENTELLIMHIINESINGRIMLRPRYRNMISLSLQNETIQRKISEIDKNFYIQKVKYFIDQNINEALANIAPTLSKIIYPEKKDMQISFFSDDGDDEATKKDSRKKYESRFRNKTDENPNE